MIIKYIIITYLFDIIKYKKIILEHNALILKNKISKKILCCHFFL